MQLRTQYAVLFGSTITLLVLLYYKYYCSESLLWLDFKNVFQSRMLWFKMAKERANFNLQWLRLHKGRIDWQAMVQPCADQMAWGSVKTGWGKANRTSGRNSYIVFKDIQQSGQFSRVFIQTRTASGKEKTIGGDFWRVYFTGPAEVAATVFDHRNGSYEAIALLIEPGNYSVHAYLDYSLCDGFRDPPEDWFRIGNAQGKYQADGVLGFLDEYLYEPLQEGKNITLEVFPATTKSGIDDASKIKCSKSCRSLWDGHGRWKNRIWLPYLSKNHERSPRVDMSSRAGVLWIFGDSLAVRFQESLSQQPLCKNIFIICIYSYNWLYPISDRNEALGRSLKDDLDFRPSIILESIRTVLRNTTMKSPHSLLVLNLGLHFPVSINFTSYQKLIDDVIVMLSNREKDLGSRAGVIWKTTTAMYKERAKVRNATNWRFFTQPRVRLFDSYAMSAMCKAGIPVLDVFPLTASYIAETTDAVHYENEVFISAEIELEAYAKTRSDYSVCMA